MRDQATPQVQRAAPVPIDDVLDLLARVSHVTAFPEHLSGGPRPRPAEVGYVEVVAFAMHDRCHSLLGATHLLLSNGFVHEAAILGRPLFSASLTLAELAVSDATERGSLLIGISLDGLARHEEYLRAREELGQDVTADRQRLVEARRGEERMARELGLSTKHRKPDDDLKGLAAKHGRSSEYTALLLTHQFVHGASGVVLDRVGREGDAAVVGRSHRASEAVGEGLRSVRRLLDAPCWPRSLRDPRLGATARARRAHARGRDLDRCG